MLRRVSSYSINATTPLPYNSTTMPLTQHASINDTTPPLQNRMLRMRGILFNKKKTQLAFENGRHVTIWALSFVRPFVDIPATARQKVRLISMLTRQLLAFQHLNEFQPCFVKKVRESGGLFELVGPKLQVINPSYYA